LNPYLPVFVQKPNSNNSVDTRTDEIMQRVIREKFSSHTVLTVAHKLESILDYDKVVVLEEGRIIETGVPYDLLSQDGSHFRRLYYAGSDPGSGFGVGYSKYEKYENHEDQIEEIR
jgi:ABC-type multidrug transport system ATPase subunit